MGCHEGTDEEEFAEEGATDMVSILKISQQRLQPKQHRQAKDGSNQIQPQG